MKSCKVGTHVINEKKQEHVEALQDEKLHDPGIISYDNSGNYSDDDIDHSKYDLQTKQAGKVFCKKVIILSNVLIIEIGDSEIEDNCKQERKIENCKIDPVTGRPYLVLHFPFNTQNINGLDKQIHK
jgi:hypothetical protein